MSAIRIVDTSVFCNILGVPNRSQDQQQAIGELESSREQGDTLLLPMAAVYETGNHISQQGQGGERRKVANLFAKQVRKAMNGESPFSPTQIHDTEEVKGWLENFPRDAMQGIGIGDRSIIEVWQQQCTLNQARRVVIWAYDSDLDGYDRKPSV
jgi:hypothetical protein